VYWSIKIRLLLIYALQLMHKISAVYQCIYLQRDAGSWPLQLSKFGMNEK